MIRKRLNSRFKLVSHFDNELILNFSYELRNKYSESLEIEDLGDMGEIPTDKRPSIFVCEPLKVKYEHLVYDSHPDYWGIFATHVVEIQGGEIELSRDMNGILTEEVREQLPPEVYQDIAIKIIKRSNRSGADVFFSKPVGYLDFAISVMARDDAKKIVNSGDAIIKNSD